MYDEKQLCDKIVNLYPEIGMCGVDIHVTKDHREKTWVVHLKKESHRLNHFLTILDADKCMNGTQCVALGLEIAQLKNNIAGQQF